MHNLVNYEAKENLSSQKGNFTRPRPIIVLGIAGICLCTRDHFSIGLQSFWGPLDINVGVNCRAILPPLSVIIWDRKVNIWLRRRFHKAWESFTRISPPWHLVEESVFGGLFFLFILKVALLTSGIFQIFAKFGYYSYLYAMVLTLRRMI